MKRNQKIVIREATPEDTAALLYIYAPYIQKTAITFEYEVPSVEEFRERIKEIQKKYPYLIAELNGEIVGYAYAGAFHKRAAYDWCVETSIYVKQDEKRNGVGRELYQVLEDCLQAQGITNLYACIACPEREDEYLTKDSIRFHEKMGYQEIGMFHNCGYKFERWYHMVWMEKMLGDHLEKQPKVKPFSEVKRM